MKYTIPSDEYGYDTPLHLVETRLVELRRLDYGEILCKNNAVNVKGECEQ